MKNVEKSLDLKKKQIQFQIRKIPYTKRNIIKVNCFRLKDAITEISYRQNTRQLLNIVKHCIYKNI